MKRIISFAILFASYNLNANELYNCLKIADYKCTLTIFENWKDPTFNKQEYTLHKGLYDYLAALYQSGQEDSVIYIHDSLTVAERYIDSNQLNTTKNKEKSYRLRESALLCSAIPIERKICVSEKIRSALVAAIDSMFKLNKLTQTKFNNGVRPESVIPFFGKISSVLKIHIFPGGKFSIFSSPEIKYIEKDEHKYRITFDRFLSIDSMSVMYENQNSKLLEDLKTEEVWLD